MPGGAEHSEGAVEELPAEKEHSPAAVRVQELRDSGGGQQGKEVLPRFLHH